MSVAPWPARPRRSSTGPAAEVRALIRLAREHEPRFAPLLALLFATGLRRGEALGLHWSDVDLDSRVFAVRRAITKDGLTTPKSGKARRVRLPPGLAEELFDLLASRRREALFKGWPDVPPWVFCSEVGGAPDPSNTERAWLRLRRRAHKVADPAFTLRVYAHAMRARGRPVVRRSRGP